MNVTLIYLACLFIGACVGYFAAAVMFFSRQNDDLESIFKDIEGNEK